MYTFNDAWKKIYTQTHQNFNWNVIRCFALTLYYMYNIQNENMNDDKNLPCLYMLRTLYIIANSN